MDERRKLRENKVKTSCDRAAKETSTKRVNNTGNIHERRDETGTDKTKKLKSCGISYHFMI